MVGWVEDIVLLWSVVFCVRVKLKDFKFDRYAPLENATKPSHYT